MKKKRSSAAVSSKLIIRPIRRWSPLFLLPVVLAFAIGFVEADFDSALALACHFGGELACAFGAHERTVFA